MLQLVGDLFEFPTLLTWSQSTSTALGCIVLNTTGLGLRHGLTNPEESSH